MRKANRVLSAVILGLIVIGITGCGSGKGAKNKSKKPQYVEAVAAKETRMVEVLKTTGDVVAVNTVTLHSTVEGPISFCPWREGDRIEKAGEKLIEIDRPLYRQEVSAAEAALAVSEAKLADLLAGARPEEIAQAKESVRHFEDCTDFAKADFERTSSLVESGALPAEMKEKARVSYIECQTKLEAAKERVAMLEAGPTKTEIGVARANVREAKARRDLAQAKLDECVIKAPFAGVITEVFVRPGDLATPRASLLKMMAPSSLVVRAGLPETCAADIRKGTDAIVRLDAYPNKKFSAKIERVYPRLEWDSRTRIIEAKVTDPVDLLPRLFARLSVQGRVVDKALTVPDAAIVTTPRGHKVVYVVKGGKANKRVVTIGLEEKQRVQITDGLRAGEMVVVTGNLNLKDGAKVRVGTPASSDKGSVAQNTPPPSVEDENDEGCEKGRGEKWRRILFQDKFPARLRKFKKSELRFRTLDELCDYFRDQVEKHTFARYIGTFDHYSHTTDLGDGVIGPGIIDAKIVLFCFGKKLKSPEILSVRPRAIGICETDSQFIISFLEAPSSTVTETMERWVDEAAETAASVEDNTKKAQGGGDQ